MVINFAKVGVQQQHSFYKQKEKVQESTIQSQYSQLLVWLDERYETCSCRESVNISVRHLFDKLTIFTDMECKRDSLFALNKLTFTIYLKCFQIVFMK